jgi:hypothetical protein
MSRVGFFLRPGILNDGKAARSFASAYALAKGSEAHRFDVCSGEITALVKKWLACVFCKSV